MISALLPHCFLYLEGRVRASKLHRQLETSPSGSTYVLYNIYIHKYILSLPSVFNASTIISPSIQKDTVQQCRQQWNLISYIVPQ